ncbi:MAG: MoaD/ThiS family protein [Anaerolineaceae bacterium]|nr:MoaD/ThiS family protein [Anaerolineaceae bacterium]
MNKIKINFYAHLKVKAGTGEVIISMPPGSTMGDLIARVKELYPSLIPQLSNIMIMVNKKNIFLEGEVIPENAEVAFLPPAGGGEF